MIIFLIVWLLVGIISAVYVISIIATTTYKIVWSKFVVAVVVITLSGPIFPIYILFKLPKDD